MSNKHRHIRQVWGLARNPFPEAAIHQEGNPFSSGVFPDEYECFLSNLVFGGVIDRRSFGFLWSKGPQNEDTGFGKTTILRESARTINADFGAEILRLNGMDDDELDEYAAVAAYAAVDTTNSTGVYPVLFSAAAYLADPHNGPGDGRSVIDVLRDRICDLQGIDPTDGGAVVDAIVATRRRLGPTLPPLRQDGLDALLSPRGAFADFLAGVSAASRIRSGLQFLDLVYTVARAADVPHLFIFVDQLEDLATNNSLAKARRTREVGRLRDIFLEDPYYAGHLHGILTLHVRAQTALDEMWYQNRLPSFDPNSAANAGSIVVLRGLRTEDQVRELLVAYLDEERRGDGQGELTPFEDSALAVLRESAAGRVGIILRYAHYLIDRAADAERETIDGSFASAILSGTADEVQFSPPLALGAARDARALDDILQ